MTGRPQPRHMRRGRSKRPASNAVTTAPTSLPRPAARRRGRAGGHRFLGSHPNRPQRDNPSGRTRDRTPPDRSPTPRRPRRLPTTPSRRSSAPASTRMSTTGCGPRANISCEARPASRTGRSSGGTCCAASSTSTRRTTGSSPAANTSSCRPAAGWATDRAATPRRSQQVPTPRSHRGGGQGRWDRRMAKR